MLQRRSKHRNIGVCHIYMTDTMAKTRIQIARSDIVRLFQESPQKIFRFGEVAAILQNHREFWRLTQSMSTNQFLAYLLESTELRRVDIPYSTRTETRYVWGEVPLLEVILDLNPTAYLSHYGAVRIHGLTEQLPKTLYVNVEQPQRVANTGLTQKGIDFAFRQKPRVSNNYAVLGDYRVYQLHGKDSGRLGVVEAQTLDIAASQPANVRVTSLERTLIDITVRPVYAGGPQEVLNAYRYAADRVSINRLVAMLKRLNYTYPYHQSVGYYLEKSGAYRESSIQLVREIPREFDFYLTYQMSEKTYLESWRLWVPKGMDL